MMALANDANAPDICKWSLSSTGNGYVITNAANNKVMNPAFSNKVTFGIYYSNEGYHEWEFQSVSACPNALLLYDTSTGELIYSSYEVSNPATKTMELGTTQTPSQLDLFVYVCDTSNTSQAVTWETADSTIASIVSTTGNVTGNKRGEAILTANRTIGGVTCSVRYELIVRETIYVVNYYDETICGDTATINAMSTAVAYLNTVYYSNFRLFFVMDGTPILYSNDPIDACTNWGDESPCDNSCAFDCADHHKNVIRISTEIAAQREANHVYILWSNCKENIFCINSSGLHETESALARVWDKNRETDAMEADPVALIYSINKASIRTSACPDEAYMAVALAHEIAHTLGHREVSNNRYFDNVYHDDNGVCIMENYSESNIITIYETPNMYGLCNYCIDKLKTVCPDTLDVY